MTDTNPTHDAVDALLQQNMVLVTITAAGATKKDNWECDAWRVTFHKDGKELATDYFTGIGHRKVPRVHGVMPVAKPVAPHPAGILDSLILDATALDYNFGDWCAEFGGNPDSIKVLTTYTACCDNGRQLRATLGTDLLGQLKTLLEDY